MNSNEYMNAYMKNRYIQRRNEAITTLGGCCVKCGSTKNLHFHHKDPSQKSFTLAKGSSYSKKRWDEEVAKCELLCESHHLMAHQCEAPHGTARRYWAGCRCEDRKKAKVQYNREYERQRALRK